MNYNYKWCLNKDIGKDFIFTANFAFKISRMGVFLKDEIRGLIGEHFTNYKDMKLSIQRQFPNDYKEILFELEKFEIFGNIKFQIFKTYFLALFKDLEE